MAGFNKIVSNTGEFIFGGKSRNMARMRMMQKHAAENDMGSVAKQMGGAVLDWHTGRDMGKGFSAKRAGAVATRNGLALGGYMAAATIPRYFSGGSLTTNNQGESDIAGIPFI